MGYSLETMSVKLLQSQARSLFNSAKESEPVSGFEPLTVRLQGAFEQSLNVRVRRLMCHLAASIIARSRLALPRACLCWLPLLAPSI